MIVRDGESSLLIHQAMGLIIHVRCHVLLVGTIMFVSRCKNLNDLQQSAVPHEFREYYDPSGALRSASTNIQFIDPPICS